MSASIHDKLNRVRKPRVHITYQVETEVNRALLSNDETEQREMKLKKHSRHFKSENAQHCICVARSRQRVLVGIIVT